MLLQEIDLSGITSLDELCKPEHLVYPDIIYCNLTLRSLGRRLLSLEITNDSNKAGGAIDENELKTTIKGIEVSKFKGRTYHQPAINCWLHSLSSPRLTPPLSDDAYQ